MTHTFVKKRNHESWRILEYQGEKWFANKVILEEAEEQDMLFNFRLLQNGY